jgi:hypothetical protein
MSSSSSGISSPFKNKVEGGVKDLKSVGCVCTNIKRKVTSMLLPLSFSPLSKGVGYD